MMAAYNAAPYIGYALQSILRQRTADIAFDIVVVNDGSTDETGDIVRSIGAPEIRLIETPNQGVTRARNVALDHMADDIDLFTFLDADDLFPAGRFARDVVHFATDPSLELLYGSAKHFRDPAEDGLSPADGSRTMIVRGINLGCGLYRSALATSVGPFDVGLEQAEDTDWILRAFESEPQYKVVDDICLYYRRHASNMTRDTEAVKRHLAQAVARSLRRRKTTGKFSLPPGIFDTEAILKEPPL
jgi:glycosyltransferase involved in cell wall biosynthesis